MKVHLKYKTEKGGWVWVRCSECNGKRSFSSFAEARRYMEDSKLSLRWKAIRVD